MTKLANGQFQQGLQSPEVVSTRKKELPAAMQPFRWQPGQSGNPAGRPPGSRNKLGEKFVADLNEHWQRNGTEVLDRAAKEKPADYLKVVAMILLKDIRVTLETMSDNELSRRIEQLTDSLGLEIVQKAPKTIEQASHVLPK